MILIDVLICRETIHFVTKSPIFIHKEKHVKVFVLNAILFLSLTNGFAQYRFSGHVSDSIPNQTVYLSLIEDYRKVSRTYLEQIILKTATDSTGFFEFTGDNLLHENRIYKIHIDECSEAMGTNHFFGSCDNTKSVLFIANVKDTIYFPTTFNNEVFCDITSTNTASGTLLAIDALKEEMVYDFTDFRSDANLKLNSKKWFGKLQEYGNNLKEPLAELYIYEFLSDRRNETYDYYLKDVQRNSYYEELLDRLQKSYPATLFTELYESDIHGDQQLNIPVTSLSYRWIWILSVGLFLSLFTNVFLIYKRKTDGEKRQNEKLQQLTQREQNIVSLITKNKTNKEIAAELFISVSTVKTHINNLYKKLNVTTRAEITTLFDSRNKNPS